MRDYRQIDGMIKQASECLHHAYDRGYNKGIADGNINDGTFAKKMNEAYNNGVKDAWECYSKNLFNFEKEANRAFQEYMKERKSCFDDEIQVGDEVYNLDPENVRVVTAIYDDDKGHKQAVQICKNGKYAVDKVDTLKKTGKHYDEIESILDQMKGE